MPSVTTVPPEAQPSPASTWTPPPKPTSRRSRWAQCPLHAYFEGGYWLILWDFIYGAAISLLLLNLRWSARMREPGRAPHALQTSADLRLLDPVFGGYFFWAHRWRYMKATRASAGTDWPRRPSALGMGPDQGYASRHRPRRPAGHGALRYCAPFAKNLVDLGIRSDHDVPARRCAHRSDLPPAPLNKVDPLANPKVTEPILSLARAKRDRGEVYLSDGCLAAEHAHERQRLRPRADNAHHLTDSLSAAVRRKKYRP